MLDNAPMVELDESIIQEVLNKRCMTAVANEYLVALHGKGPHGKWILTYPYQDRHMVHRECSVCGDARYIDDREYFVNDNHCPNCGAKMDGGDLDE